MASANALTIESSAEHNPGRRSTYYASPAHSSAARQGTFGSAASTPDPKRRSLNVPAESAIASSPLLRVDDAATVANDSPNAQPKISSSAHSSLISAGSLRLSKDLGHDIDWEAISGRDEEDEAKMRARLGSESDEEGSQASNGDQLTYSALSKRADFILANAKRKLNLLEGNLGRARHSLTLSPTLVTELGRSDSGASAQSAPSPTLPKDSPNSKDSNGNSPIRGPKINFGTPRQPLSRLQNGHARGYSDSTVPSPQGNTTVGSRSFDYRRHADFGKRHPLHKSPGDMALDSVPENPVSPTRSGSDDLGSSRRGMPTPDQAHEGGRGRSNTEEQIKEQAGKLRNRISYLQQQRSRDASERRRSQTLSDEAGAQRSRDAHAATDGIRGPEEDSAQESGELERGDSRVEWRQVLESGKTGPGSAGSYLEDDEEDDEYGDEDTVDASDDAESIDEDPAALQGAHEDRNDAFDYEHFILHSIMGSHIDINPEDYASSEEDSALTDRQLDEQLGEDMEEEKEGEDSEEAAQARGEQGDAARWAKNNGSQSSFHTAHSDEADRSESGSDRGLRMGSYRDTIKASAWPVPPSGRRGGGAKHARKESKAAQILKRRPESMIVQHVTAQEASGGEASPAAVQDEDRVLFYAVAHSFREVCLRLQKGELGPHDSVDLRQRLEIARRVLDGDL